MHSPKLFSITSIIISSITPSSPLLNYMAGFQDELGEHQLLSVMASNGGHGENSLYFDGWKAYDRDPYHPTLNPDGIIQMGLAENQLCHDLMEEWIRNNPEASICTKEGLSCFKAVANFQDYHGFPFFREAVAKFMEKVRGGRVRFDPDRIVMSGGATGAQETLAFCLADPGDAFLIPVPYYPAFDRDFCWRTRASLLPIHCSSSNNFKITISALESAYQTAQKSNIRVKGILVVNPSNPLGTTMDKQSLQSLLCFANHNRIHLICDEIFAGTVFGSPCFISLSEILEANPSADRSLVHVVCSLSKDLGLPGFRVGVIYSYNDAVVACARKMSSFGMVSSQTQHFVSRMLADEEFTSKYLAENARRIKERHAVFSSGLRSAGIRCLEGNGGLFCWMDLRRILKEATAEGEADLWRVIVGEVKLNVSPGCSFHCDEPGWFRLCFANMDDETAERAVRRIRKFVEKKQRKKTMRRVDGLRLSLPRRYQEEMTLTPRLMSPQSPLVHATT